MQAAEARDDARRAASEKDRHVHPARHRDDGPRRAPRRVVRAKGHALAVGEHLDAARGRSEVAPHDGEHHVARGPKSRPEERDLQAGGASGVADERVREPERFVVERTRRRDPEGPPPRTPQVLDRREEPPLHDLERAVRHPVNLTSSPGVKSVGGFRSGSKRAAAAAPRRFHPPGISAG